MVSGLICFSNKQQLSTHLPELFEIVDCPKSPEEDIKMNFRLQQLSVYHIRLVVVGWKKTSGSGFRRWKNFCKMMLQRGMPEGGVHFLGFFFLFVCLFHVFPICYNSYRIQWHKKPKQQEKNLHPLVYDNLIVHESFLR